jgi:hypothetical protein
VFPSGLFLRWLAVSPRSSRGTSAGANCPAAGGVDTDSGKETPKIWPQGGPDMLDEFQFNFQDRAGLNAMLEKLDSQLQRILEKQA